MGAGVDPVAGVDVGVDLVLGVNVVLDVDVVIGDAPRRAAVPISGRITRSARLCAIASKYLA